MAHVTSVHYAISNPFIYTIIFNFFPLVGDLFAQAQLAECFVQYFGCGDCTQNFAN